MVAKRPREPSESEWLGYDPDEIQEPACKRRSLAFSEAFSLSSTFNPQFRSTLTSQVIEAELPQVVLPEESSSNLSNIEESKECLIKTEPRWLLI